MGLTGYIQKNAVIGDCSNDGISSRCDKVTIVNVADGPFEPSEDAPAVLLMEGNTPGTVKIVPAEAVDEEGKYVRWPMAGGTYIATSDSRFSNAVEKIVGAPFYGAVAFHDRFED